MTSNSSNLIKLLEERVDAICESFDALISALGNIVVFGQAVLDRVAEEQLLELEPLRQLLYFLLGVHHAAGETIRVLSTSFKTVFDA